MKQVLKTTYHSLKGIVLTAATMVLFSCGSHPKTLKMRWIMRCPAPLRKLRGL